MQAISSAVSLFGFFGKHAAKALPLGVIIGLLLPSLASILQPLLVPALLVPLTLSLVRIESVQFRRSFSRWHWILLISCWILILRPTAVWLMLQAVSLPDALEKATLITSAAPPVTACVAIAVFLGVDAAIVAAITVVTMLLVPLSLPPVVYYFADLQIQADILQMSLRLAAFILCAFVFAGIIKKLMGSDQVKKNGSILDGISVVCIGIFIIAIMHGVSDMFARQPGYVILVLGVSTVLVFSLYVVATALFWRLGPGTAIAIGLVSGNCNMGLMYLVLADQAPLELLIFFAIGQIQMYFLPSIFAPLISKKLER
jgi:BASS family bile acid:Na+ symporter